MREQNPAKVSKKINIHNFSYEVKIEMTGYIKYVNLYDSKIENYSDDFAFLELVLKFVYVLKLLFLFIEIESTLYHCI